MLFEPSAIDLSRAISRIETAILDEGVSEIREYKEVSELEIAARQVGKPNLVGEHFRRELNTLPPEHVLWVGLHDRSGQCVTTVAAKLDCHGGWSLQQNINFYIERVFDAGDDAKVTLKTGSASYAGGITGKSVYVGEGHVHKDWRGKNLLGLAQRMLILMAYNKWHPEIIYGFMRPDKIARKYHLNWGYSMEKANAVIWQTAPAQGDLNVLHFVALGPEGVCRLCQDPLLMGFDRLPSNSKAETGRPAAKKKAGSAAGNAG